MQPVSRRSILQHSAQFAAGLFLARNSIACVRSQALPDVSTITTGPKFHWFGYYDKQQFDSTNTKVLSNQVSFEHRTPVPTDKVSVGYIDIANQNRWTEVGQSTAWGWQQGCMLQWRPASVAEVTARGQEVVWNDRTDDGYVCRIKNINTAAERILPRPIYTLSGDGTFALSADFARIQRMRPGYGYVGRQSDCHQNKAPEDAGIWKMDMETGESKLIFSLADAAAIDHQGQSLKGKWNYFNHLLMSPDSTRFIVLHRWRNSTTDGPNSEPTGRFYTRMFTVNADGSDRYILDPDGHTSHFIWRDSNQVCAWTKPKGKPSAFYVFTDQSRQVTPVGEGVMTLNGHNTYVPETNWEWILNDTYPDRKTRAQSPYLYHVPSNRRVELGHFHLPKKYSGEWRCDTHPRCSNDGQTVCIDSPHLGDGRQLHLIKIGDIIDAL
ncbi:MAG: hypothetical protein ABJZ55_14565 [Fuerstiella sp.]